MVQTKKFQNTFLNEYLAIQLHERDVEERAEQRGVIAGKIALAKKFMAMGHSPAESAAFAEIDVGLLQ